MSAITGAAAAAELIISLSQAITAAINIAGASAAVSNIIGNHIAAGSHVWTEAERDEVTKALQDAKDLADQQITAAGAPATGA